MIVVMIEFKNTKYTQTKTLKINKENTRKIFVILSSKDYKYAAYELNAIL